MGFLFWVLLALLAVLLILPLLWKDKLVTAFLVCLAILVMMLPDHDQRMSKLKGEKYHATSNQN